MVKYTRFRGDLWTINMNIESSSSITSQTDDELTVTGTFRTTGDMVGLYWNSEDIIPHPHIKYETNYDYTGVVLEFEAEYEGDIVHLDDPDISLAVYDTDDTVYFVPFSTFSIGNQQYRIDFDNIISQSNIANGVGTIEEQRVDPRSIHHLLIPLISSNYNEGNYTIINNKNWKLKIKNITVTGGDLNVEEEYITDNPYHICEGYDDSYNLTPRRLAKEMRKLGYKDWMDIYIGASHFYEKSGTPGENSRPTNGVVDYSKMEVDPNIPLTPAFRAWWKDYVHWLKIYDTPNIVCSISMENLQMPVEWRQRLADGTYGQTGWTPGTYFYSPCNLDARDYIESVARACLDIMVEEGVTPILQWGEPWWWWQELYPESISIDPDNQTTNTTKYPHQPPAFYDDATREKYLEEMGEAMPVYTTSWPKGDLNYTLLEWLRQQLVEYSEFMRDIVKSYTDGLYTILYFPPSILDTTRVPKMMQYTNFPVNAFNGGKLDFVQIEDYDWVIEPSAQHNQIYDFATEKFGIDKAHVHYFGGYCQYPNNAIRDWGYIIPSVEDAIRAGIPHVYVWSGTQVRRDNIVLHAPVIEDDSSQYMLGEADDEIKTFNIIVMNQEEEVITWLDPDLVEIKEINKTDTCRTIQLKTILEERFAEETPWFNQGNKIFIPETMGITSCLYVINTEYNIDYIDRNIVEVTAEEVLVELNYEVTSLYPTAPINVTRKELEAWFGEYYKIGEIDTPTGNKQINPYETLTLMDLYRMIEEKTERVFVTEYLILEDNTIERRLHLKNETNLRNVAQTEYLDLNWNLKSLELEVSEENTYTAMAPILSKRSVTNTTGINLAASSTASGSSNFISAMENLTSDNVDTSEDALKVFEAWKEHEVEYREYVPMICEKNSDGSVNYTAYWYAPFKKAKDSLFIEVPYTTDSNYPRIMQRYYKEDEENRAMPKPKTGHVTTSETDPNAIYNVCANALLEKLHPVFKLKVDVADIQDLLGVNNLGYTLYETLYVRPPRFNYYIPCYVSGTEKDPHQPGLNKITIETDVKGLHEQKATDIISNDIITSASEKSTKVGGLLLAGSTGVEGELVTINIRLDEAYNAVDYKLAQSVLAFKPESETYVFSDEEIQKAGKLMNQDFVLKRTLSDYYNMRTVDGKLYAVPCKWAEAIYYTRNQAYIKSDNYLLNAGKFKKTIAVHYYKDHHSILLEKDDVLYYPSHFYDLYDEISASYKKIDSTFDFIPVVVSSEHQSGANCVPAAVSNMSSYFKIYKTEGELKTIFNTGTNGTLHSDVLQGFEKLGWRYEVYEFTKDNLIKYLDWTHLALILVDTEALGYSYSMNHAVVLYEWYYKGNIFKCGVLDSNKPLFSPSYVGKYDYTSESFIDADTLIDACVVEFRDGKLHARENGMPVMVILQPPLVEEEEEEITGDVGKFEPDIKSYTFSAAEMERAWTVAIAYTISHEDTDNSNVEFVMTDINGVTYKVPYKWINCGAYAYMHYYRLNWDYNSSLTVDLGFGTTAEKYYNHLDTEYGWFTPCYPEKTDAQANYTVSSLLFDVGYLVAPSISVSSSDDTNNDDSISLSETVSLISNKTNNKIHAFIVDATKSNILKYLRRNDKKKEVYILIYCAGTEFDNYIRQWYPDTYQDRGSPYPLELYLPVWDNQEYAQVVFLNGNGNSPTNRYDVAYANSNTHPQLAWRIEALVTASNHSNVLSSDRGKMMVISYYTKAELDAWYEKKYGG